MIRGSFSFRAIENNQKHHQRVKNVKGGHELIYKRLKYCDTEEKQDKQSEGGDLMVLQSGFIVQDRYFHGWSAKESLQLVLVK